MILFEDGSPTLSCADAINSVCAENMARDGDGFGGPSENETGWSQILRGDGSGIGYGYSGCDNLDLDDCSDGAGDGPVYNYGISMGDGWGAGYRAEHAIGNGRSYV